LKFTVRAPTAAEWASGIFVSKAFPRIVTIAGQFLHQIVEFLNSGPGQRRAIFNQQCTHVRFQHCYGKINEWDFRVRYQLPY
jgi:hypothetical protein